MRFVHHKFNLGHDNAIHWGFYSIAEQSIQSQAAQPVAANVESGLPPPPRLALYVLIKVISVPATEHIFRADFEPFLAGKTLA